MSDQEFEDACKYSEGTLKAQPPAQNSGQTHVQFRCGSRDCENTVKRKVETLNEPDYVAYCSKECRAREEGMFYQPDAETKLQNLRLKVEGALRQFDKHGNPERESEHVGDEYDRMNNARKNAFREAANTLRKILEETK